MAWRVFYAIMLARAVPEMPCDVLLELEAWQALECAIHHCPPLLTVRPRWARPCAGSRSSAGLGGAAAATNQGLRRCGVACHI